MHLAALYPRDAPILPAQPSHIPKKFDPCTVKVAAGAACGGLTLVTVGGGSIERTREDVFTDSRHWGRDCVSTTANAAYGARGGEAGHKGMKQVN
jgi:hypothetical protein